MSATATSVRLDDLRRRCHGTAPLSARLEPWQVEICDRPETLDRLLDEHGSPVNLIDPAPMARNAAELEAAATAAGVRFRAYFARKANKALTLVDAAKRLGLGLDVASERELAQVLTRGVVPADVVVTAAIKPPALLELCLETGATVVVDNLDELEQLIELGHDRGGATPVALRLAPRLDPSRTPTRFGLQEEDALAAAERLVASGLGVDGVHFHLDGYRPGERLTAIGQSLELIDRLRTLGAAPRFLDIGGGIPISYLDSEQEWERFWCEHRRALLGEREPLTFERHGLGLAAHDGSLLGTPNVYPYHQRPVRGEWLAAVLAGRVTTDAGSGPAAAAIRDRGLELRCEPGRSLLDGCGVTVARVMFTKPGAGGARLVGVAMNRTQCRSTSDEFLVDPLLLRSAGRAPGDPAEGFLVGAYCIERELLSWRRLSFPDGVEAGDLIVFPNTAGYLMHILESASHQIPLARNLIVSGAEATLDPIDS